MGESSKWRAASPPEYKASSTARWSDGNAADDQDRMTRLTRQNDSLEPATCKHLLRTVLTRPPDQPTRAIPYPLRDVFGYYFSNYCYYYLFSL